MSAGRVCSAGKVMDRLNAVMVRASFVWLLAGVIVGGLMLVDQVVPGDWRRWAQPTHGHMLFVGWFVQFALGIAYWLLPRRRTPERPLGYNVGLAFAGVAALNLGLLLRVIAEPAQRSGVEADWVLATLVASAVLQLAAVSIFVVQLWPRLAPRAPKPRPPGSNQPSREESPS
jgi:hypothetical protein